VRLYSLIQGVWQYSDYSFNESGTPAKAVLTTPSPAPSPALSTSEVFNWTAGNGVTQYALSVGTTGPGASNLFNSNPANFTGLSSTAIAIPSNGATVYVRLWSLLQGVWQSSDYTFTEP
jgi:hypothetical protein